MLQCATANRIDIVIVLFITIACYLLDQVTKFLAFHYLPFLGAVPIVHNFFYLVHVQNTGAAFGIFQDKNRSLIIVSLVALAVMGLLFVRGKFHTLLRQYGGSLFLAGILGNLTDRLLYGSVVDFLDFIFPFFGHWPAFNMADSYICIATGLFIYSSFHRSQSTAPNLL